MKKDSEAVSGNAKSNWRLEPIFLWWNGLQEQQETLFISFSPVFSSAPHQTKELVRQSWQIPASELVLRRVDLEMRGISK